MYSPRILSFVFFLIMCLLAGCGGGGGGSSTPGGGGPTVVYLGTTGFNPATSRGLASNAKGFAIPSTWTFRSGDPGTAGSPLESDQTFTTDTITVSGTAVPCYRVAQTDPFDAAYDLYEWWAVATDGGLYRMTKARYDYAPNPDDGYRNNNPAAPVLLSQARLIVPATLTMGTAWTVGSAAALNITNTSIGHLATRTVVGVNLTSPHGFPGCVRVKAEGNGETWFEWWMDDHGLVELEIEDAVAPTYNYRADFSASG